MTQYLIPPPIGYPQNIEELLTDQDDLIFEAEQTVDDITELLDIKECA